MNAIDILSHDDLSKIKHLMALPVNLQGLPSLSLLENLKMATTTSFVSITNEGPTIHIHLQFKLFNKEPFQIVGSHDDRLALSTDFSTNFIIMSSKNDIIYTKHNQIFLRGRFVNYHKQTNDWTKEFTFAANFQLISNTILISTKDVNIHISCHNHRTTATIPKNSVIKVPHHCSIASDFFDIPKLLSSSSINIKYELRFLELSHGQNVSVIKDIRHIQLSYDKVTSLAPKQRTAAIEASPYSYLSPLGMQCAIAIAVSSIPWLSVCIFANFLKKQK